MSRFSCTAVLLALACVHLSCTSRHETAGEEETDYLPKYTEWYNERAYPRQIMNWDVYPEGHRTRDGMFVAPPQNDHWQYIGPTNLQTFDRYGEGLPPLNGRINALAYDPADPDNTYYAATACGGVWKTTNAGTSWYPLSDDWKELYTSSIAISPAGGRIFVGTGDYPGSKGSGIGLRFSDDGGQTWHKRLTHLNQKRISDIVIDPDDPSIVTVATGRGSLTSSQVYRSVDGGNSFDISLNLIAKWGDLAISAPLLLGDKAIQRYYYVGGFPKDGNDENEFWRSDDRGQTWEEVDLPEFALDVVTNQQIGVAASTVFHGTVYAVGTTVRQVWKSVDAGDSWVNLTLSLPQDGLWWDQDFYSFRLHSFPRMTGPGLVDALFLATTDVFLFNGFDWESIGGPTYSHDALIHVDLHAFATHPSDPSEHLIASDGGVYRYDYDPNTNEGVFTSLNKKLGCVLANRVSVHPTNPNWLMGGTQDNGTPICAGDLLNWYNVVPGDTGHSAINQVYPQVQYACRAHLGRDAQNDIFIDRTVDYWAHRNKISTNIGDDKLRHGAPILIDPNNFHLLYLASNYLYQYDENTQSWDKRLGGQKLSEESYVRTFEIAPSDSDRIITGSDKGEVWMTSDRGEEWRRIDESLVQSLPDAAVSSISIDPTDRDRVIVAFSGTWDDPIWECKDVTEDPLEWKRVRGTGLGALPKVPINAVARNPSSPKTHWFVGTDIGVFGTNNAGVKWYNMTNPLGLPNIEVTDLKAMPKTNFLYASTFGRGFWRIKMKKIQYNSWLNNSDGKDKVR